LKEARGVGDLGGTIISCPTHVALTEERFCHRVKSAGPLSSAVIKNRAVARYRACRASEGRDAGAGRQMSRGVRDTGSVAVTIQKQGAVQCLTGCVGIKILGGQAWGNTLPKGVGPRLKEDLGCVHAGIALRVPGTGACQTRWVADIRSIAELDSGRAGD